MAQMTIEGAVRRKAGGASTGLTKAGEFRPQVMKVFDPKKWPRAEGKPASTFGHGTTGFERVRRPIQEFETRLAWLNPEVSSAFDALEGGGGVEELRKIRDKLEEARTEAESAMAGLDTALAELQKDESRHLPEETVKARLTIWNNTVAELKRLPLGIKQHIDEHKLLDKLNEIIGAQ